MQGIIAANGAEPTGIQSGWTGACSGGAGGGGRVAIYSPRNIGGDWRDNVEASGGSPEYCLTKSAAPGTVYIDVDSYHRFLGVRNLRSSFPGSQTYVTDEPVDLVFDSVKVSNLAATSLLRWWAPALSVTSRSLSIGSVYGDGATLQVETVSNQRVFLGYYGCSTQESALNVVSDVRSISTSGTFMASSTSAKLSMGSELPLLCSYWDTPLIMTQMASIVVVDTSVLFVPPVTSFTVPFTWGGTLGAARNLTFSSIAVAVAITANTLGSSSGSMRLWYLLQDGGTLTLASGFAIFVSDGVFAGGGTVAFNTGSTIAANNTLSLVSTAWTMTGGSVSASRAFSIFSGSTVTVIGSVTFTSNGTFYVSGTLTATGGGWGSRQGPCHSECDRGGGGSHAGCGSHTNQCPVCGTCEYGSLTAPTTWGSGGDADPWGNPGGKGGGALYIVVSGNLSVAPTGVISSNGEVGRKNFDCNSCNGATGSGGGAGGSIYIRAGVFASMQGLITANGAEPTGIQSGWTGACSGGAGGGGRVAIYCDIGDSRIESALNIESNGGSAAYCLPNPGVAGCKSTITNCHCQVALAVATRVHRSAH